jgi:hypothetical protein
MNVNDIYPPLNLVQVLVHDDQTILSDQLPHQYLMRQIGLAWFRAMEEVFHDSPVGTRILVRRDTSFQGIVGNHVTHDYIMTRVAHNTLYGGWTHQSVAYLHNEVSPYPFDIDAFADRDQIIAQYRMNHMINPLPEGHMEVDEAVPALPVLPALQAWAEAFLQPPPGGLSSNSLFTFQ